MIKYSLKLKMMNFGLNEMVAHLAISSKVKFKINTEIDLRVRINDQFSLWDFGKSKIKYGNMAF
jgi:hypothetical protein